VVGEETSVAVAVEIEVVVMVTVAVALLHGDIFRQRSAKIGCVAD
jgi:hypothetical protein